MFQRLSFYPVPSAFLHPPLDLEKVRQPSEDPGEVNLRAHGSGSWNRGIESAWLPGQLALKSFPGGN